jgi:hypothetical protein
MQALGRAHNRADIWKPGGGPVVSPDTARTQATRRRAAENPAHIWGTADPRPAVTWPLAARDGGQTFPAKARHCGRLATSWICSSFTSPSWPPLRVLTLGRRRQRCATTPRAPGRLARTCLSGRPRRSRSGRVPALPARSQRKVPSGLCLRFHGVARRTSLPSAPEDTSSSPGHAARQDVSGWAPLASDDSGGLQEPATARRGDRCRGLPWPRKKKRSGQTAKLPKGPS